MSGTPCSRASRAQSSCSGAALSASPSPATFTRTAQLHAKGLAPSQIAFLLNRSRGLIESYLDLLAECAKDKTSAYHLEELLRLGTSKKTTRRLRAVFQ